MNGKATAEWAKIILVPALVASAAIVTDRAVFAKDIEHARHEREQLTAATNNLTTALRDFQVIVNDYNTQRAVRVDDRFRELESALSQLSREVGELGARIEP